MSTGRVILPEAGAKLAQLIETAVTEFASIASPESLAKILARQARRAKAALPARFSQAVQPLLDDFAKALGLHFEGPEGEEFLRSSLVQTAFYGVFAAWTLWHQSDEKKPFRWEDLADYLRIPFLAGLFYEFRHPTRLRELQLAPHLEQATATLGRVVTERFFSRFAMPHLRADSEGSGLASGVILYFYEPFLEAFDPDLRKELGVWYTPQEVVRYQVQKIDRLLREELGCERGFAEERVVVLDPCCGTGAYLIEVLRCVATQLESEGVGAILGARLLDAFCHRILGFEVLTAPFVIAQLQLYLILEELGVAPDESHRPSILLTNALTGWKGPEQIKLHFPELQKEHDAARRAKHDAKIIVILGNPPYNRFAGAPPAAEENDLADAYKGIHRDESGKQIGKSALFERFGVRKHLLDDLYIRFFRLAEERIGQSAEYGVVSFISNSSFLMGRSHPLMRESLVRSFDLIWIDNLNGDKYKTGKIIPAGLPGEGTSDQSIFSVEHDPRGIQVGASISTLLKRRPHVQGGKAEVRYRDFWGLGVAKRHALLAALDIERHPEEERQQLAATPAGPRPYVGVATTEKDGWRLLPKSIKGGFEDWPSLDEIFPTTYQGVNPNRGLDGSLVDTGQEALEERMRDYFSDLTFEEIRDRYPVLCEVRAGYEPKLVREATRKAGGFQRDRILPYLLFPLDARWIYYETETNLLNRRRPELWENLEGNLFLVTVPQPRRVSESRPLVATTLFDLHLHDRGSVAFPVHVWPHETLFTLGTTGARKPHANFAKPTWEALAGRWKLHGGLEGKDAIRMVRSLFGLGLALGHAPQFEADHKEALAQDWIHLPIPKARRSLEEIAELGEKVAVLLNPMADAAKLLKSVLGEAMKSLAVLSSRERDVVRDAELIVTVSYYGAAQGAWEERAPEPNEAVDETWGAKTGDLFLNDRIYLKNVPERVWRYELGGYPVMKKWLGYRDSGRRPGRPLTLDELDHLRGMALRIAALLCLHADLDRAYEKALEDPFTAQELGLR